MMFIESPFLGYPTCLLFAHVAWGWTALWTARTTRRIRPGRWLAVVSHQLKFSLTRMWYAVVMVVDMRVFILSICLCTVHSTEDCWAPALSVHRHNASSQGLESFLQRQELPPRGGRRPDGWIGSCRSGEHSGWQASEGRVGQGGDIATGFETRQTVEFAIFD